MHKFTIIISAAVFAGCVSTDNYDSSTHRANPFDEKPAPQQKLVSSASQPKSNASSPVPAITQDEHFHSSSRYIPAVRSEVKPLLDPPSVVSSDQNEYAQRFQSVTEEMIEEARRLKTIGDFHGATQLLEQAGYSGNPEAFYELSRMYQDGSLYKDDEAMLQYLTQAHDLGHMEATRVLGHLYLLGMVVPQDMNYGEQLMQKAAGSSLRAALEYGEMLIGLRSPDLQDTTSGIEFLEMAVQRGHTPAIPSLIRAYEIAGRFDDALVLKAESRHIDEISPRLASQEYRESQHTELDRALLQGPKATYDYALQILIRKVKDNDPEFTGYCLMAVAGSQGYEPAIKELRHLDGIRTSMARTHPGKIENCIADYKQRAGLSANDDYE